MTKIKILDCTLRDGSYANNFQFTADDTRNIVQGLEEAGVTLIEVGHGVGLGASEKGFGVAAETDESYLEATADVIKEANWGMFCIPGIADLSHLDMAADYGMKFVRIGTTFDKYKEMFPFIDKAKKHNMYICCNFMKSHLASPKTFAEYAKRVNDYGSDVIYLVDSSGGMLPNEIEAYIKEVKKKSDKITLGFHGHNNIGLGVANSLVAQSLGVKIIDVSLQGFGRSAGNTPSEQFLSALLRQKIDTDINLLEIMDLGEQFIQPLICTAGISSIDTVLGLTLFHSSHMPIIKRQSAKYRVDSRELIISISSNNLDSITEEKIEEHAKILAFRGNKGHWKAIYKQYYGEEQSNL